jgi:transcriptional regulator GlxA family with amidase domain
MTRKIGFLVFPEFQILDLTGPLAAFEMPGRSMVPKPYRLQVLSESGGLVRSSSGLTVVTEKIGTSRFDTVIAIGGLGAFRASRSLRVKAFMRRAAKNCRRVTSVCSGTFILDAAGLLDGLRATTHWSAAALLQRQYPEIRIESDRIYVKQGSIWTAAGVTAGIDLALALIEEDLGPETAKGAARQLVVYYRRPGGQSQFSTLLDLEATSERVQRALSYARAHLGKVRSVEQLAKAAGLSPRQFGRLFLAETGQTPAKAVEKLRAELAKTQIEQSDEPIEAIARAVGFSDPERMRRAFIRTYGQPPQALRRIARVGSVKGER